MNTPRTLPVLLSLFPDNTSGLVNPQDVRDLIVSGPIRSPGDWLFVVNTSPVVGQVTWNGTDTVSLNAVDADGIDRSGPLAALATPGALLRMIDATSGAYLVARIVTVFSASAVWTMQAQPLATSGAFAVHDLVALGLVIPYMLGSPGASWATQNQGGAPALAGTAVATDSSGSGFVLAIAGGTVRAAVGLMQQPVGSADFGFVQSDGLLTLPDWSAATGGAALVNLGIYFLDPASPGQLTTTPPAAPGQIVQVIGRAVDPQILLLSIGLPILL